MPNAPLGAFLWLALHLQLCALSPKLPRERSPELLGPLLSSVVSCFPWLFSHWCFRAVILMALNLQTPILVNESSQAEQWLQVRLMRALSLPLGGSFSCTQQYTKISSQPASM